MKNKMSLSAKKTVAFDDKEYFDNYYGKGKSYFDHFDADRAFQKEQMLFAIKDQWKPETGPESFLDLGAANGAVMRYAKKDYPFKTLDGVELSQEAVSKALPGCNILHGDVLEFLKADRVGMGFKPKYDVVLASLLMYFDQKSLVDLLVSIKNVCHDNTLVMFPLDPDTGNHHGYKDHKYVKHEPEAFVSIYRPLGWWIRLIETCGYEIVNAMDPLCLIVKVRHRSSIGVEGWAADDLVRIGGNLLGMFENAEVTYLDNTQEGVERFNGTNSAVRVRLALHDFEFALAPRPNRQGFRYWKLILDRDHLTSNEKIVLKKTAAFIRAGGLGITFYMQTPPIKGYVYVPGLHTTYNKRSKTSVLQTDLQF